MDRLMPYFFFNDTTTTEIYTLSLHDALPISVDRRQDARARQRDHDRLGVRRAPAGPGRRRIPTGRSAVRRPEEDTFELQTRPNFVCQLFLYKKIPAVG